ncbi:hypothetical protein KOR34_38390 [Posidoniimonas corsicana]|uniref:Post-SET domain-containing protein n=1 Tax=Posidoniimonas corsicana TaxID=1938618 RepID=A0A5C5V7P7_9BACT|nr:hypothetical protein KOR34_38390 [Posidoniimonas corsicana]
MRIYPRSLPVIPDEPQAEDFRVIDVDDHRGQGVEVLRGYRAGELLFRMNGVLRDYVTQFTLQVGPNQHLDDPYVAGKVLHSCDPNCRLDPSTRRYLAVRDIEPGELLTMDYDLTEDYLFKAFECRCGADRCRGYVAGRLAEVPATAGV